MTRFWRRSLAGLGAAALILTGISPARADYSIEVISGSFDSGLINAASPFALSNNSSAHLVSVDVGALNTAMDISGVGGTGFHFTVLGGSSNVGDLGSETEANLLQNGTAQRISSAGSGFITIIARENGFVAPLGSPKTLTSAAADTFANFKNANDNRTFSSSYIDANHTVTTPLLTFAASLNSSGNVTTAPFAALDNFSLSNTTVVTMADAVPNDQFSGTTFVRSVPEPGSLALMGLGGVALAIRHRRRRASV